MKNSEKGAHGTGHRVQDRGPGVGFLGKTIRLFHCSLKSVYMKYYVIDITNTILYY
jgi:hypothetical protein